MTRTASPADRAVELYQAAMTASDDGHPAIAVRHLRTGLRVLDRAGADDAQIGAVRGRLLLSLAWSESERGRVHTGFALLDQAAPLIAADQRPILSAQRALMLKRVGRNDEALAEYDAAVAGLGAFPLHLVKALNNRSMVHLEAGRVSAARADLHRCLDIAAEHGLAVHVAISRMNLGCLDVIAGDLPAALRAFTAARIDYERLIPGRLGNLAMERARALVAAGLFGEADRELATAIEQATRQRLSNSYAMALLVRAEAALLADRPLAAAEWARQARARFTNRTNARWAVLAALTELRADQQAGADGPKRIAARGRTLAARLERLGLVEDARVACLVAGRSLIRTGSAAAHRTLFRFGPPGPGDRLDTRLLWRLARAELATEQGRPREADRHLIAGLATLHRHRAQVGCLDLQTGAAVHGRDLASAGIANALASGSVASAYRWSERVRAQALLLPQVRPPEDRAAAAALEELRQLRYAARAAELAGRTSRGLRTRIDALQRIVREHSWGASGVDSQRPALASLAGVRAALEGSALVAYLRDGAALWGLAVTEKQRALVPLAGYDAAAELVLRLRADLDAQAGRAMPGRLTRAVAEATQRDREALADAILNPLLRIVGDRDLVITPTGLLVTTPWSALPGCCGRPVTVAPSATSWLAAVRRLRRIDDGTVVLVAGPGNARGDAEIDDIARFYPHRTVLKGPDARPSAVLAALGEASTAHIAAHGHHEADNALFSTLDLAGGVLMGYDLPPTERMPALVVLSSCDVGLIDVRPGDETFGMVTAMLAAGSATVVSSVTRVADDAAVSIMTRFHRAIHSGRSPSAALAEAASAVAASGFVCFGAG